MGQQVRTRKQATVSFEANNKVSEKLSRGMVYRELYLMLEGAPTLTAANNTQAKTLQGDEWAIIKKIEIIANHTQVIHSIDGNALFWLNYILFGTPPRITSNLADAATANPPFKSMLILPFWLPRSVRPMDFALDSRQLAGLDIEITWGQYTDINADATAWTTNPTLKIYSLESFGAPPEFDTYRQWRTYKVKKQISASSSEFDIDFAVGNLYRAFLMNFTDAGVDDEAVLNNMKLVSGSTVFADLPNEVILQRNKLNKGISQEHANGAAVDYLDLRRGTTYNQLRGWSFYDHVSDGYNTEAIDTFGFSEFKMQLDVTVGGGTTFANIYPIEIIPIRQ